MYTFSDLRNEVLRLLDEYGDTGTTKANVDNAINQAHFQRLTEQNWPFMLYPRALTFSLVSGTQNYPLHLAFNRPLYFRNRTTRQFLREVPQRELIESGADWNNDSVGDAFTLWGRSPVAYHPTSASAVSIVSTSAADNVASKNITVYGETASGLESEDLTPNGTSTVTGNKSFIYILGVTKAAAWAGTMTMTSNGGAVTNLTLLPSEYGRSYQQFSTLWIPASADTIEYRFYRNPRRLTADNDIPDIPFPFSQILVWDALLILTAYDNQSEGNRIAIWRDNQTRTLQNWERSQTEGGSLNALNPTVRYQDEY